MVGAIGEVIRQIRGGCRHVCTRQCCVPDDHLCKAKVAGLILASQACTQCLICIHTQLSTSTSPRLFPASDVLSIHIGRYTSSVRSAYYLPVIKCRSPRCSMGNPGSSVIHNTNCTPPMTMKPISNATSHQQFIGTRLSS